MKHIIYSSLFILVLCFTTLSCSKDCGNTSAACIEVPPTQELCLAFFTRWFYDKDKNICEEVGYSGCSQKGFATKQACDECKCK